MEWFSGGTPHCVVRDAFWELTRWSIKYTGSSAVVYVVCVPDANQNPSGCAVRNRQFLSSCAKKGDKAGNWMEIRCFKKDSSERGTGIMSLCNPILWIIFGTISTFTWRCFPTWKKMLTDETLCLGLWVWQFTCRQGECRISFHRRKNLHLCTVPVPTPSNVTTDLARMSLSLWFSLFIWLHKSADGKCKVGTFSLCLFSLQKWYAGCRFAAPINLRPTRFRERIPLWDSCGWIHHTRFNARNVRPLHCLSYLSKQISNRWKYL